MSARVSCSTCLGCLVTMVSPRVPSLHPPGEATQTLPPSSVDTPVTRPSGSHVTCSTCCLDLKWHPQQQCHHPHLLLTCHRICSSSMMSLARLQSG